MLMASNMLCNDIPPLLVIQLIAVCHPQECHTHLHISAAGHLHKVLLLLQCLVDLIICHAEAT